MSKFMNVMIKYDTGEINEGVTPTALAKYLYCISKTVGGVITIKWEYGSTSEDFFNDMCAIREAMMDWKYTPIKITGADGNPSKTEYFHIPNEGNSTIILVTSPEELATYVSVGSIYTAIEEMTDTDIEMNETFADFECLRGNAAYEKRAVKYLDIRENVDEILRECEKERKRAEAAGEQYTEHWLEKIQCHRAIKRYPSLTAEEIDAYIHSLEKT